VFRSFDKLTINTNDPMAFDKASLDKLGTNGIEFD